ncbi:hypothetical protein HanXRQr2_Chr04g0177391 [Helianthus annuus]|uniref:Uncharacterized protein n=1 Tax=Helianthus annuus TaxID=4232 RepID=A0A9K3J945_HELAN|nr:hypothetical protein HanXRQr2_Chr04g0177391 [Helianthus annuus]
MYHNTTMLINLTIYHSIITTVIHELLACIIMYLHHVLCITIQLFLLNIYTKICAATFCAAAVHDTF